MWEYLTKENMALGLALALSAWQIIKAVAAMTSNKTDDAVVNAVERGVDWARSVSPHIWTIVETLAAGGKLDKAEKLAEFMRRLDDASVKITGKNLTVEAKAAAMLEAEGMSAADRLMRLDPQPAPVEVDL